MNQSITIIFDLDRQPVVAELNVAGEEHQTADIRQNQLVISKATLVSKMRYKIIEDRHIEIGYTKKTMDVDVVLESSFTPGYTYVDIEPEHFTQLMTP
jgi:hypothetical protein